MYERLQDLEVLDLEADVRSCIVKGEKAPDISQTNVDQVIRALIIILHDKPDFVRENQKIIVRTMIPALIRMTKLYQYKKDDRLQLQELFLRTLNYISSKFINETN